MAMALKRGDKVILDVPDNPRLHQQLATVLIAMPWGAHVTTEAAATGNFRALHAEMKRPGPAARESGYTGDVCDTCGGARLRRNGSCLLCDDCGSTTGCS